MITRVRLRCRGAGVRVPGDSARGSCERARADSRLVSGAREARGSHPAACRRTDEAVALARDHLAPGAQLELIEEFPVRFSFAGHARYVADAIDAGERAGRLPEPGVAVTLARYTALILLGDFKLAGACAARLRARAHQVVEEVDAGDWACARALAAFGADTRASSFRRSASPRRRGRVGTMRRRSRTWRRALGAVLRDRHPEGLRHRRPAPQGRSRWMCRMCSAGAPSWWTRRRAARWTRPGERDGELEEARAQDAGTGSSRRSAS